MIDSDSQIWYPGPEQIAGANVSEIIKLVGVKDYDELYRYSIENPAEYWRAILKYCEVVWSNDYAEYADFSRGKEFPKWFVGGKLNWTDTVFRFAKNPATASRKAVVAESEDGKITSVSYAELFEQVRAFAAGLKKLGLQRGDRVGYLMEPGIEAVVAMIALSYMGAVVMPLFSGFGIDPIIARLSSCTARALIATSGFMRRAKHVNTADVVVEATQRCPVEFLILKLAPDESLPPGAIAWSSVPVWPAPQLEAEQMGTDDPVMVFYTSGTTGKPKGTVHVHGGFPLKILHDGVVHFDIKDGDVFFWPADMGWVAGALIITATLMRGATMICYNGAPDFPD